MTNIDKLSDANNLIKAFNDASVGSIWKSSVQRYEINLLKNVRNTQIELRNGTYKQGAFYEFELNERGHNRRIKALGIKDRVIQRSLCDNILTPDLSKYLVHDNGASQKNKGVDFCRRRLDAHLHKYYRKYGNDGYFLHIDFRKFFDNIPHDKLIEMFRSKYGNDSIMPLIEAMIRSFRIDISYTDADIEHEVFNSMEYAKIPAELKTGKRYMGKSLGIGSQISQIAGIFYPTEIDTYCKVVRGCRYYGRYMDDIYIIHPNKEYLRDILKGVRDQASTLGLFINENKTQIFKIRHGFSFLKIRYILTESGKIIKRPDRANITRQRRKMRKFRGLVDNGRMSVNDAREEVRSWLGATRKLTAYRTCDSIESLWSELFDEPLY